MIASLNARLTYRDRDLLLALREHAIAGFARHEVVDRIERKLASAAVLAETECVQIGSELVYQARPEPAASAKLVLGSRHPHAAKDVVVTTPLGLALLGMPAGATLTVEGQGPAIRIDAVMPPEPIAAEMARGLSDLININTHTQTPQ